ncbi:putative ubie coq5 [Rosellinia necatrix]|uniref:Putative ubie coq5 n=1 Tax=Rosellinia necatrix TaxID=77044 RepID=A0A1W2TWX2_ROSNE|nr:putative ubie coq5 [Rosellinia necatrix]
MSEQANYTHGHHASVVNSHARRTAENSAAFLLPHIKPHHRILDVGCGPGSITMDLAALVPQGSVIGIDTSAEVLEQARALAQARGAGNSDGNGNGNLTFQQHDAAALPFADGEFDVVFCHQVLHHARDPVAILREMARVARKPSRGSGGSGDEGGGGGGGGGNGEGGIVAAREVDYRAVAWFPETPGLARWAAVHERVFAASSGGRTDSGRRLASWAREAGFGAGAATVGAGAAGVEEDDDAVTFSWSAWHYQREEARVWADSWAERALRSGYATTALREGIATLEELGEISDAWRAWGAVEGAFIVIPSGEIVCRVR